MEVKWKGKAIGRKELEAFMLKTKAMPVKLWYVAKAGFTAEARAYTHRRVHEGDITVESRPGEGSAFTVTLPKSGT